MSPLLILLVCYALTVTVLAARSSAKKSIVAGAPSVDLVVFLVTLMVGSSFIASPNQFCLAPFLVIAFFFLLPLLLTRLMLYIYITAEKRFAAARRKQKVYGEWSFGEPLDNELGFTIGDDGELIEVEQWKTRHKSR
jgi:hypothetical protein